MGEDVAPFRTVTKYFVCMRTRSATIELALMHPVAIAMSARSVVCAWI